MQTSYTALTLTTTMLAHHAFDHLADDRISQLQQLILRLEEPLTQEQENLLLAFWSYAATGNLPASLLHQCNIMLMQRGCNPLEHMFFESWYAE